MASDVKHAGLRPWFLVAAALSGATAIFHVVALFVSVNDVPLWRHALFIGVNVLCVLGFVKRPRAFVWLFGALVVQQLWSHGGDVVTTWTFAHRIDAMGVGVCLVMPALWVLLLVDARAQRPVTS
jgi:hypothetical protein